MNMCVVYRLIVAHIISKVTTTACVARARTFIASIIISSIIKSSCSRKKITLANRYSPRDGATFSICVMDYQTPYPIERTTRAQI